jgi:hypothetical protein
MKLVKEHIIFEKFTEDSDPIRDLGIGVCGAHAFNDVDEFVDYVIEIVLPYLYDGSIPEDILYKSPKGIIHQAYFDNLVIFFHEHEYVSVDKKGNIYNDFRISSGCAPKFINWVLILKEKLLKLGYKD